MGYSHSVSFSSNRGAAKQIEKTYQNAILKCAKVVRFVSERDGGLAGYTAHDKTYQYGGLNVNGSVRAGQCETFAMREHFSENESFWVKTNRYQYDTVVVACLIILKHFLGERINVGSDGLRADWQDGLNLAREVLKIKTLRIPDSIKMTRDEEREAA